NCLHVQRLLVHESVYDTVSERFISMAQKYKVGDKLDESTDMGPLINEKAAIKVETMVNEALNKGAKILMGGTREGNFYAPTLIAKVPVEVDFNTEEFYGSFTVIVSFNKFDQAITRDITYDY